MTGASQASADKEKDRRLTRPTPGSTGGLRLPEGACVGERRDTVIVIAQDLLQKLSCMFPQKGRSDRVDGWCQSHVDGRLNMRDRSSRGMRDLTKAMTVASFRRIEPLLDSAKVTNR